jgi:hypothetical protein
MEWLNCWRKQDEKTKETNVVIVPRKKNVAVIPVRGAVGTVGLLLT